MAKVRSCPKCAKEGKRHYMRVERKALSIIIYKCPVCGFEKILSRS